MDDAALARPNRPTLVLSLSCAFLAFAFVSIPADPRRGSPSPYLNPMVIAGGLIVRRWHDERMVKATFVRRRERRDRVYVTRADGTSTGWDFPSYGDRLPHDMCHLVVENELKLNDGFWGLIDQGADIAPINGQATLVRNGRPLVELSGSDLAGLIQAEAVVAALAGPTADHEPVGDSALSRRLSPPWTTVDEEIDEGPRIQVPMSATRRSIAAISHRLRQLTEQWCDLSDGEAMTLDFDP